ncbi:MAG: hypothetical protein HGB18_00195 [Candidatus Moranbacteria bacterium]|nr:hypothetical protein [Candidatus Moranbacteria bacterium]
MNRFIIAMLGGYWPYFVSSVRLAREASAALMFLRSQLNAVRVEAYVCLYDGTYGKLRKMDEQPDHFDGIRESLDTLRQRLNDYAVREIIDIGEIERYYHESADLLKAAFMTSNRFSVPERLVVANDRESRLFLNRHLFLLHEIVRASVPVSDYAGTFLERLGVPQGNLHGWFRQARDLIVVGKIQMILRDRFGEYIGIVAMVLEVLEEGLIARSMSASSRRRTRLADQVLNRVRSVRSRLSRLEGEQQCGRVTERTFVDMLGVLASYQRGFESLARYS